MIIDSVKGFERYTRLHPLFEKVFEFMRKQGFEELAPGRYEIEGNNLYCNVWEGDGKGMELPRPEVHDSYIDIQVLIEGNETIGHRDRGRCNDENISYDDMKDIAFMKEDPEVFVSLAPGYFAILYPHDAHSPLIGSGKIKKAIFKVKI
jgi:YhcH/YjgK/YiaL family protein